MSLINLVLLFVVIFIGWMFWLRRGMAEAAKKHVERYCDANELQVISVSRKSLKLAMVSGRPGWHAQFQFEFSGNHEDRYQGTLFMQNHFAVKVEVPPYRTF